MMGESMGVVRKVGDKFCGSEYRWLSGRRLTSGRGSAWEIWAGRKEIEKLKIEKSTSELLTGGSKFVDQVGDSEPEKAAGYPPPR